MEDVILKKENEKIDDDTICKIDKPYNGYNKEEISNDQQLQKYLSSIISIIII